MVKNRTSGIYKITNIINNKIYIGSAVFIYSRKHVHFHHLKNNTHHNQHLQNSYNKYGSENFKFEKILECPKEYLIELEQWYIDNLKPEYNICKIAGNCLGNKMSEESKIKMSKSKKELWKKLKENPIELEKRKELLKPNINKAVEKAAELSSIKVRVIKENNEILEFKSFREAGKFLGCSKSSVIQKLHDPNRFQRKLKFKVELIK